MRRNRTYYLGETLRLQLDDIVTYPKVNEFGIKEFARKGIKIKGGKEGEEDVEFLFDRDDKTFDNDNEEEGEEEEAEEEDMGSAAWESDWEEVTEEELVLEEEEEGEGDTSFDSLSGECSKLCISEWEKENNAWRAANKGPTLVLKKKRVRRKVKVTKMFREEGEGAGVCGGGGVFMSVKNDPRIGQLKKVSMGDTSRVSGTSVKGSTNGSNSSSSSNSTRAKSHPTSTTQISSPKSTPIPKHKRAFRKTPNKEVVTPSPFRSPSPTMNKGDKEVYSKYLNTPESPQDSSPNSVCITFIQSRQTKIEYHEEVVTDDEDEDAWGEFKGFESSNGVVGGSAFATTEYIKAKDDGF